MVTVLEKPRQQTRGRAKYWTLVRRVDGIKVVVRAEQVKRLATWLVVCYFGGALFDARMTDDAHETADQMISEATMEYADAKVPLPLGVIEKRLSAHRQMTARKIASGLIAACLVFSLAVHDIQNTSVDDVVLQYVHSHSGFYWKA